MTRVSITFGIVSQRMNQQYAQHVIAAWKLLDQHLAQNLRGKLEVYKGPLEHPRDKSNGVHLCIRPVEKLPKGFWIYYTYYEFVIARLQDDEGPTKAQVALIQRYKPEQHQQSGYRSKSLDLLRKAAANLGPRFKVNGPSEEGKDQRVMKRSYRGIEDFSPDSMAKDLAMLISETLPLIQKLPA